MTVILITTGKRRVLSASKATKNKSYMPHHAVARVSKLTLGHKNKSYKLYRVQWEITQAIIIAKHGAPANARPPLSTLDRVIIGQ